MRFNKEERADIGRIHNRVLKGVLEKEMEELLKTLKISEDISKIRFSQGALSILDSITKVIK